ncbi:MAG: hypothetical protein AB1405_10195 [Bdellovibrionota bacterium]
MPSSPPDLLKDRHRWQERGRVFAEQSWQFAALPFSLALILPVFLETPWRMRSFLIGSGVALVLWVSLQIASRIAWGEAAKIEAEMEEKPHP